MTLVSDTDLTRIKTKFANMNAAIVNAEASLRNVLALGGDFVNDPIYNATYGGVAGLPAWVVSAANVINTTLSTFPAQPTISFNITPGA